MSVRGCRELQKEVIEANLCTYCGACAGSCPYLVSYRGRIVTLDTCTIPEGQCHKYCPRTETDLGAITRYLFGEDYGDDSLGPVKDVLIARATDETVREKAQYGGAVTALLTLALAEGFIDGAILTRMLDDTIPHAFMARTKEEILQGARSSFMACPVLETLNHVPRDGTDRLGIVATPCQVLSLAKMKNDPPQNRVPIARVNLIIGLFCTWALSPDPFHQFLKENCDLSQVVGFDIPPPPANQFNVYTRTGTLTFPLEHVREFIMPTCHLCMDMTAEFADISVGAAEGIEGWNTVLVRTPIAAELLERAKTRGVLETRSLPDENLSHLKTAALNKKRTALNNILEKTGDKGDLLYVHGVSRSLCNKLLKSG